MSEKYSILKMVDHVKKEKEEGKSIADISDKDALKYSNEVLDFGYDKIDTLFPKDEDKEAFYTLMTGMFASRGEPEEVAGRQMTVILMGDLVADAIHFGMVMALGLAKKEGWLEDALP